MIFMSIGLKDSTMFSDSIGDSITSSFNSKGRRVYVATNLNVARNKGLTWMKGLPQPAPLKLGWQYIPFPAKIPEELIPELDSAIRAGDDSLWAASFDFRNDSDLARKFCADIYQFKGFTLKTDDIGVIGLIKSFDMPYELFLQYINNRLLKFPPEY